MLVIAYGTDIKGLTAGIFFSRCIFLSIFFGVILDVVALLLLNSVLAYNLDEDKKLNGLVMLFQNLLRIDTKNLIFLIQLSLIIFFFWIVVLVYYSKKSDLLVWDLLRLNFLVVVLQNCIFFESGNARFLLVLIVVCFNIKFLFLFFFRLLNFLINFFLELIHTKVDICKWKNCERRANGLFGLGLIDFFNLRGIIKPLNWVYVDVDKSILVAEPTSEVILAAKLKSVLEAAKIISYLGLVGGPYLALVVVPALGGFLDIRLVFDEGFTATFCNSALNSTWASFQETTSYELETYFKGVIDNLDQTPRDKVPLRKCYQFTLDRFDAADDAEVIRRRDLAREGWVKLFFCYVAGGLLWKLIFRFIFGLGDDGSDDGNPMAPINDTFVSW